MKNGTLLVALGGLCVMGCAHEPAPTQQLAGATAALRAAEEAGAKEVPDAALHVKLAQEQLRESQQLMQQDANARARDKLMRAQNDAELALSITHEQEAATKLNRLAQTSSGGEQGEIR